MPNDDDDDDDTDGDNSSTCRNMWPSATLSATDPTGIGLGLNLVSVVRVRQPTA